MQLRKVRFSFLIVTVDDDCFRYLKFWRSRGRNSGAIRVIITIRYNLIILYKIFYPYLCKIFIIFMIINFFKIGNIIFINFMGVNDFELNCINAILIFSFSRPRSFASNNLILIYIFHIELIKFLSINLEWIFLTFNFKWFYSVKFYYNSCKTILKFISKCFNKS